MLERRDFKARAEDLAIVDLGSNSFHVLLARRDSGEPRVVTRLKLPVQLAADLERTGAIGEAAFVAGQQALERIADRLGGLDPAQTLAVGTATFRRASNAPEFLELAERVLGVPVEVLSGDEEARLIYGGAIDTLPEAPRRRLVFDIGGGSTEFALGTGPHATRVASIDVGCVTLSRACFDGPGAPAKQLADARRLARERLAPGLEVFAAEGFDELIATSGASEAAGTVMRALGWPDAGLGRSQLEQLEAMMGEQANLPAPLPGLAPERVAVFPGGFAILLAVLELLDAERASWVEGTLQDGLLRRLVPLSADGLRRRTVDALQRRFAVDQGRAADVAAKALRLFDALAPACGLGDEDRHLLEAGALLHDLGLAVAATDHARHGAWLLRQAELRGFGSEERAVLGVLVRGHNGRFPALALGEISEERRSAVALLCALLRLAVLLQPAARDDLPAIEAGEGVLRIVCPAPWRRRHPWLVERLEGELDVLGRELRLPTFVLA